MAYLLEGLFSNWRDYGRKKNNFYVSYLVHVPPEILHKATFMSFATTIK